MPTLTLEQLGNGESAWSIRSKINSNFESILTTISEMGFVWCGTYSSVTEYNKWSVVYFNSALYISKISTIGLDPLNTSAWDFLLDWPQGIPWVVTADSLWVAIWAADDATPNDTDYIATSLTGGGILKKITWTNTKAFLKTYFDTLYAKYLWDADFYKYSIVTSVASWNLTVALKNYEGNDPTASKPVKIQIGGVIRSITSALSVVTPWNFLNWFNAWSSELATKEIDYCTYIIYNSWSWVVIWISRIFHWNTWADFNIVNWDNEKFLRISNTVVSTDPVVNIGRFNATLSAGLDWSIPATSVIINSPCYETRWLDWSPVHTNVSMTWTSSYARALYKISGDSMFINIQDNFSSIGGTMESWFWFSLPFICTQTPSSATLFISGTSIYGLNTTIDPTSIWLSKSGNFTAGQSWVCRISGTTKI